MYHREIAQIANCMAKRLSWSIHKKSALIIGTLDALWDLKIIVGYSFMQNNLVVVFFKYDTHGEPVIKKISAVSKPGKKIFKSYQFFINNSPGCLYILNTSQGILQDSMAIEKKIGGEVLLKISR